MKRRVLVVDDQEGIREQLSKYIARSSVKDQSVSLVQQAKAKLLGGGAVAPSPAPADDDIVYQVDTAAQGKDAYEMVKKAVLDDNPYLMVFLDMRMPPGWDGMETMEKLWEVDPKIQIALCSAYSDYSWSGIVERVGRRDNLLILKKPFDVAEVSQMALALSEKRVTEMERQKQTEELQRVNQELQQQIIERECIGDALRYTRNYLNNVFQSLPSILISTDPNSVVTQWNTAAEKYSGIASASAMSQVLWDLLPFLNDYRSVFAEVLETGTPRESRKRRVGEPPNESYMDISIYPITYEGQGQDPSFHGVQGVVLRIDDVTELEKKSEHLRQAQKMDTVGKLAAGLAHDFKNIIGGIMGTLSSMRFTLETLEDEETKTSIGEDIEIIEDSAKNGQEMVKRLLNLSGKKQELSRVDVDLNNVVQDALKLCRNTLDKSIAIVENLYASPAMVRAYPSQLDQVLLNLCVNASHAMTIMRQAGEAQGGTLTVEVARIVADSKFKATFPEADKSADYWRLSVKDTGVGIKPEAREKIFDPFFTTKEKGQGSGLGLSMVYNIVKQNNGFLDVASKVGEGSTFYVYFAVESKPAADATVPEPKNDGTAPASV